MRVKKIVCLIFTGIFLMTGLSYGGEIDILLKKLVEKGILSQEEANEILRETKEEIRESSSQKTHEEIPAWINKIKLKGDLRLRYQWEDKTGKPDRNRGRYRFRLGLEGKVNDKIKVAAGLATGGHDARSTNQTMEDGFSTKDIKLDYAYAEWDATPYLIIKGGKMAGIKHLIFRPSDLLWDSDINLEGISLLLSKKVKNADLFMNMGCWILDEDAADSSDPFMWVIQPGVKYSFNKKTHIKVAVAGYFFENVKGDVLYNGHDSSGYYNTLEGGVLKYNYNSVAPSIEFGIKHPFKKVQIPYLTFFGDYVYNPDPPDENSGYLVGIKFGDKKIKKRGQWQMKYMYRRLEKDAWIDIFPDSDAYGGHTDVKGHEVVFTYGVGKNSTVGIDYYFMERIKGSGKQHILQLDWSIKF